MNVQMVRRALPAAVVGAVLAAGPAMAAPPNDSPAGAGVFRPYSAPNGVPLQQEALADLSTATPDAGVPRCLGAGSFARTVWYRVPEAPSSRLLTVEASGRTADPIDLAAFVQPYVAPPAPAPTAAPVPSPTPAPATTRQVTRQGANLLEPNACDGVGAGGDADAADRSSAVSMVVPAGFPVLIQVGRRGAVKSMADEAAVVALEATNVTLPRAPRGDTAQAASRLAQGTTFLNLGGATLTGEDPAEPACPSRASVWRKVIAGSDGTRLISVSGGDATTLTAFSGRKPTGDTALDCVVRRDVGALQMLVPVKRNQPVWIRVGTDSFEGDEEASVRVVDGTHQTVINGGPGGFDPTPGGPAGGLPSACDAADVTSARVSGASLTGRAGDYNRFIRVPIRLRVTGSTVCDATLRLVGPGDHVYAQGRYGILRRGGVRTVAIPRFRTFAPGRYHLEATGLDARARRKRAQKVTLTGRLLGAPKKGKP